MIDAKAFGLELAGMVKAQLSPIMARLEALEKKLDVTPVPVNLSGELAALKSAVEAIEIPAIPEAPELPDIAKMVDEAIQKHMAVDDLEHSLEELVKFAVDAIPAPKDGKDADPEEIKRLVDEAVKALPAPKDGKDGRDGEPGKDGAPGERGRDGLDVKDLFRAEGGKLVAVMSDGTTRDLGVFVGKDGKDADMAAIEMSITEKVDAIPRPRDGKDGFSLKHFDAELMGDGRTLVLKFQDDSDQSYSVEIGIPAMIYRGVFKEGQSYEKGDTVTWGGSLWHCDKSETTSKPDGAEKHWTLAAKKGRDGRDGEVKAAREPAKVKV